LVLWRAEGWGWGQKEYINKRRKGRAIAITGRELSSSIQIDEYCIVLAWLCFEWFAKQLGKNAPLSNFCTFLKIYFFYHAMNLRRGAKSLVLGV
jgi:hypothetical protein